MISSLFHQVPLLAQSIWGPSITDKQSPLSSILLSHGTVIAFNSSSESVQIMRDASVHVLGDRISGIYDGFPSINLPPHTEILNATGKIVSPGFVDSHTHGWQALMKTLASNTTLAEYVFRYGEFSPASTAFTADDIYVSQRWGLLESLNAGVTTILDHAHATWSNETSAAALQATLDSGIRGFFAFAFHDLGTNYTIVDQMNQWQEIAESGRLRGTNVKLGIAYDRFSSAPAQEVNEVIHLAR
jgi:cytosine/adenosine deaminase-related metal-dependent hydrolase